MDDTIDLISMQYAVDSFGQRVATESRVTVWAHIRSVSRAEWFAGAEHGLRPEFVFETPAVNYSGETVLEHGGKRYAVYRTYRSDTSDSVELYAQEEIGA